MGLLAVFIVIAFFGVMLHVTRIVFGAGETETRISRIDTNPGVSFPNHFRLPISCRLALVIAAVPVLLLGVYIPKPLHELLALAASALTK